MLDMKMKKFLKYLAGGTLSFLLMSTVAINEASAQSLMEKKEDTAKDATEMVQTIRSRVPTQPIVSQGTLIVRAPKVKARYVPIRFGVIPVDSKTWESVYETLLETGTQERLVIRSSVDKPNEYTLSRKAEGEKEWTELNLKGGVDTAISFAGTDFWICDLGLEFLQWPEQSMLKREMRKGRACRVLESKPAEWVDPVYARVVSWVDNETDGIVMAQAFNEKRKRVKEFEVQSFKKVDGVWQLKRMTIYNNQTDSRTTLEIDLEV